MALKKTHYRTAKKIDAYVNKVLARGGGDEQLLETMYDYMAPFREVMDAAAPREMDQLCNKYDGFYRFANLLERLAQGIKDGRVEVP